MSRTSFLLVAMCCGAAMLCCIAFAITSETRILTALGVVCAVLSALIAINNIVRAYW